MTQPTRLMLVATSYPLNPWEAHGLSRHAVDSPRPLLPAALGPDMMLELRLPARRETGRSIAQGGGGHYPATSLNDDARDTLAVTPSLDPKAQI